MAREGSSISVIERRRLMILSSESCENCRKQLLKEMGALPPRAADDRVLDPGGRVLRRRGRNALHLSRLRLQHHPLDRPVRPGLALRAGSAQAAWPVAAPRGLARSRAASWPVAAPRGLARSRRIDDAAVPIAPTAARGRRAATDGALRPLADDETALAEARLDQRNGMFAGRVPQNERADET